MPEAINFVDGRRQKDSKVTSVACDGEGPLGDLEQWGCLSVLK
jgi:hypothetical protein